MKNWRNTVIALALAGTGIVGGAVGAFLFGPGAATAQTSTAAPSAPAQGGAGTPGGNFDPSRGGHTANGITEALLSGDTASKVTAAAQAAVPGGTIQRVETDAEGSPYEAHMVKSDGSRVTVKVDKNFKVTSVDSGAR